jgi:hypothetical protein
MIARAYLISFFRAFLAGSIIFLGFITIGQAYLFDSLFMLILVALMLYSLKTKNVDLFGVSFIFFTIRLLDKLLLILPNLIFVKIIIYLICYYVCYKFKGDKVTQRVVFPLLTLSVIAELYWYAVDYDSPQIFYSHTLIVLNLLGRRVAYFRQFYKIKFFDKNATSVSLDRMMYLTSKYFIFIISLQLVEYLIRHLTIFTPLFIYDIYPYIAQSITIWILIAIIDYTYKLNFNFKA